LNLGWLALADFRLTSGTYTLSRALEVATGMILLKTPKVSDAYVPTATVTLRIFVDPDPESVTIAAVIPVAGVQVQYGSGFSAVIVSPAASGGMAKSPLATPA
jgi:hypothetical protein